MDINRKLKLKGHFRPLVVARLFKIQFSTKNFSAKYFIKIHRFHLILKEVFRPLVVTRLFEIQFPTKKFFTKIFIYKYIYRVGIVQLPTREPQIAGRISMQKPLWQNSILRIVSELLAIQINQSQKRIKIWREVGGACASRASPQVLEIVNWYYTQMRRK